MPACLNIILACNRACDLALTYIYGKKNTFTSTHLHTLIIPPEPPWPAAATTQWYKALHLRRPKHTPHICVQSAVLYSRPPRQSEDTSGCSCSRPVFRETQALKIEHGLAATLRDWPVQGVSSNQSMIRLFQKVPSLICQLCDLFRPNQQTHIVLHSVEEHVALSFPKHCTFPCSPPENKPNLLH